MSESQENYLKAILKIQQLQGYVRAVDIAEALAVSRASVSRAVKLLKQSELIALDEHRFISLTAQGLAMARKITDRYHTLQTLLIASGVPEDIANTDAGRMEHIISDDSLAKIKDLFQTP